MASADLQQFIETRLLALDPSMDVSIGSPAQEEFIGPLVSYLGTDPFETDIDSFLTDRMAQEFPDLYASDPGAIRDIFANPLKIFLDPFKREIQSIKRSQSLLNPALLSDADADALVANVFDTRDPGGFASGVARLYFTNPTDFQIDMGNRLLSQRGLAFFPTGPVQITSDAMLFNREGSRFYLDVNCKAEKEGAEYNVAAGDIVSVDGVSNVLSVTNQAKFTGGAPRQDTPTFVALAERSLTEQSLNTDRGAYAIISKTFKGEVVGVTVIGARDPEMQRDILAATSPGHAWLTGLVTLYGKLAYVRCGTVDGNEDDRPIPGDSVYVYLDKSRFPSLPQSSRFLRLRIEEVLFGPVQDGGDYQVSYLVRWEGTLPTTITLPAAFQGGLTRKGTVTVDSLPGAISSITSPNQAVHVYGHEDIYVRPVLQDLSTVTLAGLHDLGRLGSTTASPSFYLERVTLSTTAGSNAVVDKTVDGAVTTYLDFVMTGVSVGDTLLIEAGPDAGVYRIGQMTAPSGRSTLFLNKMLTANADDVRYRILKKIRLNPFEPRIVRFPFGDVASNDAQTTIGTNLIQLAQNDVILYGAQVGDTIRLRDGLDAGDYLITEFDQVLGGRGIYVDRDLGSTNTKLSYEIFASLNKVEKPLVRVRDITVLDASSQSTGISIPPADPAAIVPLSAFASATVLGGSARATGYVLPDLSTVLPVTGINQSVESTPPDRYSLGIDSPSGMYLPVVFPDGTQAELDFRSDTSGKCSWFLATCESVANPVNYPPIDPKPGECLAITGGPNTGDYLIRQVQKFKYKVDANTTAWVYLIQIYESFKVDPLSEIVSALTQQGVAVFDPLLLPLRFPSFFQDWFDSLGGRIYKAFQVTGLAAPPTPVQLQQIVVGLAACSYEWGLPARGVLRTYMRAPTVFQENTAESDQATRFLFTTPTGEEVAFRPDPQRYLRQILVPARTVSDPDTVLLPRDLSITGTVASFTDSSKNTLFEVGVREEDVLSIYEERQLLPTAAAQCAVKTTAGTNLVRLPPTSGATFLPDMVGDLLFIEEGIGQGGYRITAVLDGKTLALDHSVSASTDQVIKEGAATNWRTDASNVRIDAVIGTFSPTDLGAYLTISEIRYDLLGSYLINNVSADGASVWLTAPSSDAFTNDGAVLRWALTRQPTTSPANVVRDVGTGKFGTNLLAYRPIRIYEGMATEYAVHSVTASPSASSCTVSSAPKAGIKQPYFVYRSDVRRITSSEMDANRDGFLYYFDTEVVSLSPSVLANISQDAYLQLIEGTYLSVGYRHVVADNTRTFSTEEDGFLDLPLSVLPVGVSDDAENVLSLVGVPVQVAYDRSDLVKKIQTFVDSRLDRVASANILVRHFLPAVVSYDATYLGGSATAVVTKDIADFINSTAVGAPLDVSLIESKVSKRGGNLRTPTKISVSVYDWDRRTWVEFSEDQLGGPDAKTFLAPINGSPRVVYFLAGDSIMQGGTTPLGERILLTRQ